MVFALCFFFLRHVPYNLRGDNPAFYLLQGPFSNSACFVLRRLPLPPKREVSTLLQSDNFPFGNRLHRPFLYNFHVLSNPYIKLHLIPPLTFPFYPPYVSTLSLQSLWITAEKVVKSSEKRDFYIALPKKNIYSALCHTLHQLWNSLDHLCMHYVHIVYITALFPSCILSVTIFPISTIFSPSFFGFSRAIFFSISIYCGFTFFYHYAALVVPFCTWLCFFLFSFALLM